MKRINIVLYIFVVIGLIITTRIDINAQISVKLTQPPPYQFKVEQFWKILLLNNSGRPTTIYLKGTATESFQGKVIEATSSVITLQPGVKTVDGRDLGPFNVWQSNDRYKTILMNSGSLPSGNYDICIGVYDAASGAQIASDCIQVTVENFNRMELVSPLDNEVLGIFIPQEVRVTDAGEGTDKIENIKKKKDKDWDEAVGDLKKKKDYDWDEAVIFSWLPPVPVPPGARIRYRLKIVEIYDYQLVHSAMSSNPYYYQSPLTISTVLRYPINAQKLVPGNKYAWKVEVYVDDFKTQESETRSFEIQGSEVGSENYSNKDYSGESNQFSKILRGDKSNMPSGLALFTNKIYSSSGLNFNGAPASVDLFGSDSGFKLYGDLKLTNTAKSKQAQYSQMPLNYQTMTASPKLSIYEIPFGLEIYLTSLKGSNNESLNSFSFLFDIDELKSNIKNRVSEKVTEEITSSDSTLGALSNIESMKDPSKFAENAEKLGLLSPTEKMFLSIKTLGIGSTNPDYSEFTAAGVTVNGFNLEINPWIFYLAFAVGNNQDAIETVSFKRRFIAGRFGFGKKEDSHLYFTMLKMKDDANSIKPIAVNSSAGSPMSPQGNMKVPLLVPQENVVIGTEGKISLYEKLVELEGEAAVSGFTRNTNDADFTSESIPSFVTNIITPRLSTSFDYAWKAKLAVNNISSLTLFNMGLKRVGPGYISLAAPNIRQDQFQYDFNLDQKFANKKITMKAFYKVYRDNLIDWKQSTTTTSSYGINLGFFFPNIPFVQINYSPSLQKNDIVIPSLKMENSSDIFSLMTGYVYNISNISGSTMLVFMGQYQDSKIGSVSSKISNESYVLSQSLNFEFPLTLNSSLSLIQSKILSTKSNITEFDLNGIYQFNEIISASLGGNISNEEHFTKRTMLSIGSNIILTQWIRFELQANISRYKDLSGVGNSYNDGMLQIAALINW
ncbi:MAG: hypothetical protein WC055_09730 [Melioribacteraceae bacterium]